MSNSSCSALVRIYLYFGIVAIRPRSIAVLEEVNHFVVTFQDASNPLAHDTMTKWVKDIRK